MKKMLVGRDEIEGLEAARLRVHNDRRAVKQLHRPFERLDARVNAQWPLELRIGILEAVRTLKNF
jgi:hypothetical protein